VNVFFFYSTTYLYSRPLPFNSADSWTSLYSTSLSSKKVAGGASDNSGIVYFYGIDAIGETFLYSYSTKTKTASSIILSDIFTGPPCHSVQDIKIKDDGSSIYMLTNTNPQLICWALTSQITLATSWSSTPGSILSPASSYLSSIHLSGQVYPDVYLSTKTVIISAVDDYTSTENGYIFVIPQDQSQRKECYTDLANLKTQNLICEVCDVRHFYFI
jgi:hypothetical protein